MQESKKLLEKTFLSDICSRQQNIVMLEHDMSIAQALKTLSRHHILSAPLLLSPDYLEEGVDAPSTLLGWIDISDILRGLLDHLNHTHNPIPTKMLALMTALEKEGPKFAERTLITIKSSDDRGLIYQADGSTTTLASAVKDVFLKPVAGGETKIAHRLAVFEQHGTITNIISHMDMMKFLLSHADSLAPSIDSSISELGLLTGRPPVFSVSPHVPTLLAYHAMSQQGVSGAPVISEDEDGELIANISISDLRSLTSEHFGVLALPVAEFLALSHNTSYLGYATDRRRHAFFAGGDGGVSPSSPMAPPPSGNADISRHVVTPDSSLRTVLTRLVERHIHRVYVVDDESKLKVQTVLTPTDILRHIVGVW